MPNVHAESTQTPTYIFPESDSTAAANSPAWSYQIPHGDWTLFERHHTILTKCFHFGRSPSMFGQHLPFDRNIDSKNPEKVKHHRAYMCFRLLWISLLIFAAVGTVDIRPAAQRQACAAMRTAQDRPAPDKRAERHKAAGYGKGVNHTVGWIGEKDRQHRQKQPVRTTDRVIIRFAKIDISSPPLPSVYGKGGKKTGHAAVKER